MTNRLVLLVVYQGLDNAYIFLFKMVAETNGLFGLCVGVVIVAASGVAIVADSVAAIEDIVVVEEEDLTTGRDLKMTNQPVTIR